MKATRVRTVQRVLRMQPRLSAINVTVLQDLQEINVKVSCRMKQELNKKWCSKMHTVKLIIHFRDQNVHLVCSPSD